MTFLEKREESESIGLKEVVRQATSLLPVTDNSSVPTVEAAYKAALSAVKKEDNPENAAQFYEALGEITEVVYRSCFGDMPVTLANFSSVKEQFMQALSGRQIPKLREAYGFLLCLKHLSETDSGSRKRRSTPDEIEAFFVSIDADDFGLIFFIAGDPYSVAFIIDDTGSMREEIEAAKCLVRGFLTSERASPSKYILGTFNDPDPGTRFFEPKEYDPTDVPQMEQFLRDLNSITAHSGGDGPEYGMSGILRCIRKSLRYPATNGISHIILITDAPAKDHYQKELVKRMLQPDNPAGPDLVVHGFIPEYLLNELRPTCYDSVHALASCHLQSGLPYKEVIDENGGIIVERINSSTAFDEFIRKYNMDYSRTLRSITCGGRKKRQASSCQVFHVLAITKKVTVIVHPSSPVTIEVLDSVNSTRKELMRNVGETAVLFWNNPKPTGTWSLCISGLSDVNIKVETNFQFSVDFLDADEDREQPLLSMLPPPGCPVNVVVFTPQIGLLSCMESHALELVSSTFDREKLECCGSHLRGTIVMPTEPFSFRFHGITSDGLSFESEQVMMHEPTQWAILLSTVHAPSQISRGSSAEYVFNVKTANVWSNCSLTTKITATTSTHGVELRVEPNVVTLKGASPVRFRITVTATDNATTGQGSIDIAFTVGSDGTPINSSRVSFGIETPACACLNGGSCVNIVRFRRVFTRCVCTPQFSGARCEISACARRPCQNGGTCSGLDRCDCTPGWTGLGCETSMCTQTCQNGGSCSGVDTCSCVIGWTGRSCEKALCSETCQNGGICSAPNTCSCVHGWTGYSCSEAICTEPCLNGGTCSAPDSCSCVSGWTGLSCEEAICTQVCQNGGTCSAPNSCACTSGWTGSTCSEAICTQTCQNGGTCSAPDTCSCVNGWSGQFCEEAICSETCKNGGTCLAPDTCSCVHGWTGNTCSDAVCSETCQNGGTCSAPDTCSCASGWTGNTCTEAIKGHEPRECICPTSETEATPTPSSNLADCPGIAANNPADSCKKILDCNPYAPSGNYWISNGEDSHLMYCYMEADKCGVKGVMRVALIDMRNPSETCPSPLTEHKLDSGRRLCSSTNTTRTTCDSVVFPTQRFSYNHVCGRAVGFSFHHPCGFWYGPTTINDAYVSGLSITYGPQDGRKHIWTYAGGFQESAFHFCNCPCARFPGARSPPFVCQDFYCETATYYAPPELDRQWYTNNTLWDGKDCNPGSHCCNNALAPWFRRTLAETTTEDIEVRWCVIQQVLRDRVGTELVELYVY